MAQPTIVKPEINRESGFSPDIKDLPSCWSIRIHTFFIFLIVISVPVAAKLVLHAGIPFYIIICIILGKLVIEKIVLLKIHSLLKKILLIVSPLFSGLFALLLLVSVIITPHSIYAFFFETVKSNGLVEEYFVANLFVMITIFFSIFFGSASLKQNSFKPLLGLIGIVCGLFLIIYQSIWFVLLLFISLLVYCAMLLKKRALYFISIVVLSIFFSVIFYMINPEPEGSSLVDDFLFPQTRQWINTYFPQFPLNIDIPGYGLNHSSSRLGGKVILTTAPIFEIQTKEKGVLYIQTDIYDTYSKNSWKQSFERIKDIIPEPQGLALPVFPESQKVTVKILTEMFPQLLYTIDTSGFLYKNNYYKIPLFKEVPGISLSDALTKGSVITLFRDPKLSGFFDNNDYFLSLPPDLPESVKELAADLGENTSTDREILLNIENFLALYYRYNLNISGINKDEDFIEKFLFSDREGYCTHFATAFVILARLHGIPARYVTGYLVYVDDDSFRKIVTARSAHAWPEIWLPDQGWHIWEPTQVVNRDYYSLTDGTYYEYLYRYGLRGDNIARNSLTIAQLQDLLGIELKVLKEDKKDQDWVMNFIPFLLQALLFTGIIICSGGVLFIVIRFFLNHQSKRYWKMLVNRIVLHFKHIPAPEEKGWLDWKKNLCVYYDISHAQADTLVNIILALAYNNKLPGEEEMKLLKSYKQYHKVK